MILVACRKEKVVEKMKNKKGIVIASIILLYCVISVIYTLLLDGKINWSLLFLAICMIYIIEVAISNNKLLKKKLTK
ncbi:hypothetical protein SAMN02787079_00866 [Lysinibacillus sp. TC-37]|nr:hypothetical protein SAMN02787078_00906 [Lysinibacillus sp. SG9]SDB11661.1 hypothetical protein SAMN02787079_00866 [Lysinibacillus sp. TC-37]SFS48946.1 hypothetical protein SAMN02787087_00870 [Lysinibacillus sp. SG55]